MKSIHRTIESSIRYYSKKYPVIAVTGPRQSGKTTMLKNMLPDYTYLNLEDPLLREFALNSPKEFFLSYPGKLILNEVQQTPLLFSFIQAKVDATGKMGQYILSGSQNFQLMENITQSLAGRVALFKLLPYDLRELKQSGLLTDDYLELLVKGCYPALYNRAITPKVFFSNYIQTYVEKDLKQLLEVRDLRQFRKFLSLCAARCGQLLNLNSLANDCGISQPTAKAWISVLESSYIIYLLQPHYANFNKRVIKTPKLYFYDTGLLCHLLKITQASGISMHPLKGSIFENFALSELIKQNEHQYLHADFSFWRDSSGHEVDLLTYLDDRLSVTEVKTTETIKDDFFKGINYFSALEGSHVAKKNLIYTGDYSYKKNGMHVTSWKDTNLLIK